MFVAVLQCFLIDICLYFFKQILYIFFDAFARTSFLFQRIAAHDFHGIVFQITSSHYQTYRNTLHFIVGKLEARTFVVGIVVFNRDTHFTQFGNNSFYLCVDLFQLFVVLVDRNDNNLYRSQMWRKNQTVVVGVSHDQGTHQTSRNTP